MAGLEPGGVVALDANCLNYLLAGQDLDRQSKMTVAVREAAPYGIQIATLAFAELLVGPVEFGLDRLDAMYLAVTQSPFFELVHLDAETAKLAAEIRGSTRLKLPDAVVIATAVLGGAHLLLSNDRRLVRVAEQHIRAVYFDDWQP